MEGRGGQTESDAGDRIIGLDDITNATLEAWRKKQIAEQIAYGPGWIRSGRIFTRPDGGELHPADITKYFNRLVAALGLPPIRLHDLRHGAATLA
jgi:integrase